MTWNRINQAPLFQFLDKLARLHRKALQLEALQQAHRGILYMKSVAYREQRNRRESENRVVRAKSRSVV